MTCSLDTMESMHCTDSDVRVETLNRIRAGWTRSAMPGFSMIKLRQLPDDDPDLAYSPLLRAALLTLQYVEQNGPIGLTKTKAFKRVFVHWAAEHFDWPGLSHGKLFKMNKVLNEYDFAPLELLHFVLVQMKLARHYKAEFRLTKRGAELLKSPAAMFAAVIPFFLFEIDHAAYSRFRDGPVGNWDVWLNVLNVEVEDGASAKQLYEVFYGVAPDDRSGWQEPGAFRSCVLEPLCWAGLLMKIEAEQQRLGESQYFKTPLWSSALNLDTNDMLEPAQRH
jgi:hypothetical protein